MRKKYEIISKILFATTFFVTTAVAKVPFMAIHGTTNYFANPAYAPVVGAASLEVIERIRFDMADKKVISQDTHTRQYHLDEAQDPLWKLVKILFPSNAGSLNAESGASSSMNKYITPQIVAHYMMFAHKFRTNQLGLLNKANNFKDYVVQMINQYADQAKRMGVSDEILTKIRAPNREIEQHIRQILTNIKSSIDNEIRGKSVFPTYTTEQVLLGFLCLKFNQRDDLTAYISALAQLDEQHQIVHDLKGQVIPKGRELGNVQIKQILLKLERSILTPEDVFELEMAFNFYSPLPYERGEPISNGDTHYVTGPDGKIVGDGAVFQDCNETKLRHLLNMMIFDEKKTFNLNFLRNIETPRKATLEAFYRRQAASSANNGDIEIRTAFNQVVGDLNSLNSKYSIRYGEKTNNLKSGFVNSIRVFEAVFGKNFLPAQKFSSSDDPGAKLEQAYRSLFEFMSSGKKRKLVFNWDNVYYAKNIKDFLGELVVTVDDKFEFTISDEEGHGEITDVYFLNDSEIESVKEGLSHHKEKIIAALPSAKYPTLEAILIPSKLTRSSIKNQFYRVVKYDLSDTKNKVAFFAEYLTDPAVQAYLTAHQKAASKTFITKMFEHNIEIFPWEDGPSAARLLKVLSPKGEHLGIGLDMIATRLKEVTLKNKQTSLTIPKWAHSLEILELGKNFTDLTALKGLENARSLKILDLSNMQVNSLSIPQAIPSLEKLILGEKIADLTAVKGLVHVPNLKDLNLIQTTIKSLNIPKEMHSLETLRLGAAFSDINNLKGLENAPNLKELDLFSANISHLDLEHSFSKLRTIFLPFFVTLKGNQADWKIVIAGKFNDKDTSKQLVYFPGSRITWQN